MLQQLKYTRLPVVRSFLVFIYTFSLSISSFLILFPLISQLMYLLMCTWYMQLFVWDITASITNVKCMDTERSINSCLLHYCWSIWLLKAGKNSPQATRKRFGGRSAPGEFHIYWVYSYSFFVCFVLLFTFICALYMYFCPQNIYFYFVLVYQVISLVGLIYIWLFFSCLLTLSKTPELC